MTLPPPNAGSNPIRLAGYVRQHQDHTNWCWAAVASSVSAYYTQASSGWDQCSIAATCFNSPCCVTAAPCNLRHRLEHPLAVTGHLAGHGPGPLPFAEIVAEIDRGAVVCFHIDWGDGGGHFSALVGYDALTGDVFVEDPLYGFFSDPYSKVVSAYNGSGKWSYTYFTK